MELYEDSASSPPPVQSVDRAFLLLGIVARGAKQGTRLNDLVDQSGLTKTTAHRLLKQLMRCGMLSQGPQRIYQLGHGAFELGIAASINFPLRDLATPLLEDLARETGDSVFLTVRSGSDSLCVDRKLGSYPVRVMTVVPGHRQPLGVGAGGLAILSSMSVSDEMNCLKAIRKELLEQPFGTLTVEKICSLTAEARQRGWALTGDFAVKGVTAVGVPFLTANREPFGAISVGAISMRMTSDRAQMIAGYLKQTVAKLEKLLAGRSDA